MKIKKGSAMNPIASKPFITLQEALHDPEVANLRMPVKRHPNPCLNQDCIWHGRVGMAYVPSLAEERWQIVDEGDRWAVWFVPTNHPERWHELAAFNTESEAREYLMSL